MITDNMPVVTIEVVNGKPAVTSLQVAEVFEKEHFHVLRDIEAVLSQVSEIFGKSNFGFSENTIINNLGFEVRKPMYLLTKDGFSMLAMGYGGPKAFAMKEHILAKLNAYEANQQALPDFANPVAAARAWADALEQKQLAEAQRDEAKRTKALIGSRREATAMATASVAKREAAKAIQKADDLAEQLGLAGNYRTVKSIKWLSEFFDTSIPAAYSQIGKALNKWSKIMNLEAKKIDDPKYGNVNGYHVDVIDRFHYDLMADFSILEKYRR